MTVRGSSQDPLEIAGLKPRRERSLSQLHRYESTTIMQGIDLIQPPRVVMYPNAMIVAETHLHTSRLPICSAMLHTLSAAETLVRQILLGLYCDFMDACSRTMEWNGDHGTERQPFNTCESGPCHTQAPCCLFSVLINLPLHPFSLPLFLFLSSLFLIAPFSPIPSAYPLFVSAFVLFSLLHPLCLRCCASLFWISQSIMPTADLPPNLGSNCSTLIYIYIYIYTQKWSSVHGLVPDCRRLPRRRKR